jgi:hypothetical protein
MPCYHVISVPSLYLTADVNTNGRYDWIAEQHGESTQLPTNAATKEFSSEYEYTVRMTTSTRRIEWCKSGLECQHVGLVVLLGLETTLPVYPLFHFQQRGQHVSR